MNDTDDAIDIEELTKLLAASSPEPWKWIHTPSAHSLDYPQGTPDTEWDGTDEKYLNFDELKAADGEIVLMGVWCNDSTAEVGPANANVAKLLALAPRLAQRVVADATKLRDAEAALGSAKVALMNRANAMGRDRGAWDALAGAALYDVDAALAKLKEATK